MVIGIAASVIGIAVAIDILVLRKRKVRGATSLMVFSFALTIWACAFGILLISRLSGLFWLSLVYLSATVTSTALLTFILAYTNHQEWLGKWSVILLCLEPLATQVLFWTNHWQDFFSTGHAVTSVGMVVTSSPWYWINASYSDGLMILALVLLIQTFLHKSSQYMLQSITIVIGVLSRS